MAIIRTLLILLTLQASSILAQDIEAISTFTLGNDNNVTRLIIEYNVNYTGSLINKDTTKTKNVFDKIFGGIAAAQERKALTTGGIKTELIKLISRNSDLKLEPKFPKDVLEIIELIKGKKKKEKARQIYIDSNPEKLISTSEKTSMNAEDGQFTKTITISYTCLIIVGKKTSLNIPAFLLLLDNKTFQTKPMTISL